MKGKIEFTLPEENDEFLTAVHASDYRAIIEDVLSELRQDMRYDRIEGDVYIYAEKLSERIYLSLNGVPH